MSTKFQGVGFPEDVSGFQTKANLSQEYSEQSTSKYPSSKVLYDAVQSTRMGVGNGTITIKIGNATVGSFGANAMSDVNIDIVLKKELYTFQSSTNILDVSADFTQIVDILKNGVEIYEGRDYTISSNIINFVKALDTTDVICVKGK